MTGSLVSPVFPEVVEDLGIDPQWAGTLVSMHTLTIALFSPFFGILADRIGKVRVLLMCLVLYAIFGACGGFAHDFWTMLASRACVGAASGGIAASSIGLVGTMYDGEMRSRILGYTTSALATTSIFFPLIGGWVGSFHWQFSFFLYSVGVLVAVVAMLVFDQRAAKRHRSVDLSAVQGGALIRQLKQSDVMLLFLTLLLTSAVFYVVIVYAPLYFKQAIGATTVLNGAILASRAIGAAIIAALGASRLSKRLGITKAIALGFVVMAITLITIPFLTQAAVILPIAVLFGMGYGLVMPNLYEALARLADDNLRTTVLAVGTGAANLGQFLSPIFLGSVWKYHGIAVFFLGAGMALAIALLGLMRRRIFSWPLLNRSRD
jgi:predicted MFS family arabinose efflux permease